jgi:ribosomal protein L11 methyltransferase
VIRLAVRVAAEQAELVLAELLVLSPGGVEEAQPAPGVVEYAIYGSPGEVPSLPDVNAVVGNALVEVSSSEVPDDWSERWKQFHRPVLVDPPPGSGVPSVYVRPPWEPVLARGGGAGTGETLDVAIDPAQAFGTGAHATTRLCLELLLELAAQRPARGPLIDVGTGSGVLAIAAALLGYEPVAALDNDPLSVAAAADNAAANGVAIATARLDVRSDPLPGCARAVMTANLLAPLLRDLAGRLAAAEVPPAHVIASGLLVHEVDEVAGRLAAGTGLREQMRRTQGDWAAVLLSAA